MVCSLHKYQERNTEEMSLVKETKEIGQVNAMCGPE